MLSSTVFLHPASYFILGALLLPLFDRVKIAQKVILLAVPLLAFWQIHALPESFGVCHLMGFELTFGRVDKLTYVFLHVFTLMALIGAVYCLHVKETGHHIAAFLSVAGSLGTTFAGDYLTI
ncbi:MAG: Na+/H+ antiporter subunit D, partial [Deltaproteobacteria bacterium]